jgi:hypothetical protein
MLGFNGGRIGKTNTVFTGTVSDDPNYSSVSLLLNGNGTNGSTTFTDSSSYGHTVTPVGNAQISTTQSKFGGASIYLDGSGDYLSVPSNASFDFGSGNFTVEFWIYFNSVTGFRSLFNKRSNTSVTNWIWLGTNNSSLVTYISSNGSSWDIANLFNFGNTALSTGQWYHIALVRNGTEIAAYVNGTKSANTITTSSSINFGSYNFNIGGDTDNFYSYAYIDDLRITKGVARYTANFTPPTAQLPGGETGTFASGVWTPREQCDAVRREIWPALAPPIVTDGLALHLDAGNSASYPGSGTTWTDLSGNGNNGTINGATYDSADGGSLSFDGSNDYATTSSSLIFSANATISVSCWFRTNLLTLDDSYFRRILNFTNNYGIVLNTTSVGWYAGGANLVAPVNISTNIWYKVDYVYTGTQHQIYLNGNLGNTNTSSNAAINSILWIGRFYGSNNGRFNGNIAQVSIYNKALTQSEVTQNFNALKGRYGL